MNALHCPSCGYNLTGLPEDRCPECGVEFNPLELREAISRRANRSAFWTVVLKLPFLPIAFSVLERSSSHNLILRGVSFEFWGEGLFLVVISLNAFWIALKLRRLRHPSPPRKSFIVVVYAAVNMLAQLAVFLL